ncbi:hypothetical protein JW906_14705 [bacterium]|nr:hypothetical protein [bacterium]
MKVIRIFLLLVLPALLHAVEGGVQGGSIPFDVDVAGFRVNDTTLAVEVYISVPRVSFKYDPAGDHYQSRFEMQAGLYRNDSLQDAQSSRNIDTVQSLELLKENQRLYNQFCLSAGKGRYKLHVRVTDLLERVGGWYLQDLEIEPYSGDTLRLSDIQIAQEIIPESSTGPFIKNGFRIIPNPGLVFGLQVPVLFYYMEIYHLSGRSAGEDSTYEVGCSIRTLSDSLVKVIPAKRKMRAGRFLVEVGRVAVSNLKTGAYRIVLEISDPGQGRSARREKWFWVYREQDFEKKKKDEKQIYRESFQNTKTP